MWKLFDKLKSKVSVYSLLISIIFASLVPSPPPNYTHMHTPEHAHTHTHTQTPWLTLVFNHHPLVIRSCFLSVYPEACWIKTLEEIIINNNQTEPIKTDYLLCHIGCYTLLWSHTHMLHLEHFVLTCEYLYTPLFCSTHTYTNARAAGFRPKYSQYFAPVNGIALIGIPWKTSLLMGAQSNSNKTRALSLRISPFQSQS